MFSQTWINLFPASTFISLLCAWTKLSAVSLLVYCEIQSLLFFVFFLSLFLFFLCVCVCLFYTKFVEYAGFLQTLKVLEKWSAVFKTLKIWKWIVHRMPLKVCELDFLSESDMPMILSVTLRITTWIASDLGWLSLCVNYNHRRAITWHLRTFMHHTGGELKLTGE